MEIDSFDAIKEGLILCLLGSDKPIVESLNPNLTDQRQALDNQFKGMTDIPFSYAEFERARIDLIDKVNSLFDKNDKEFLLSFERGEPDWEKCCAGDLSEHPSVKWKLRNIVNLKSSNPVKFGNGVEKLRSYFDFL